MNWSTQKHESAGMIRDEQYSDGWSDEGEDARRGGASKNEALWWREMPQARMRSLRESRWRMPRAHVTEGATGKRIAGTDGKSFGSRHAEPVHGSRSQVFRKARVHVRQIGTT